MTKRRKIPTKNELLQLQKLYKTDEKIGERLGGVPAYLVAYWRRKKNVPKHSVPKFSEKEILSLWERFGDDDRCGLELGISKAAFYNWRRRYGIKEKPAFLKLEQLELSFPGMGASTPSSSLWGKLTVAQKILARAAGADRAEVGETVEVEPDLAVCQGNVGEIIELFREHGVEYVWNPARIALSVACCAPNAASNGTGELKATRDFARRQRLRSVYSHADGSCDQVVLEHGHILPGALGFVAGSEIATFGCLAGFGAATDAKAMAKLWATGKIETTVPGSIRVDIGGRRSRGVYTKDVVLSLIKRLSEDDASGKVIEYFGSTVSQMTISERVTLVRMSREAEALTAICPFDSNTRRYLTGRTAASLTPVVNDKNAVYERMYQINIDHLTPQIAALHGDGGVRPVAELEETPINLVMIGGCVNGRFDDLRAAADIVKNKKIHADCRLLVYPASRATYLEALKKGLIRVLAEAGATIMPPGCGAEPPSWARAVKGDRCVTTGSRHCPGCSNADGAEIYIASPATAAASALSGAISDPTRFLR